MKTKRTVFIYNTKETTEQEAKYIVDILNCDDSMLWDESDHDGVEVFEVPIEGATLSYVEAQKNSFNIIKKKQTAVEWLISQFEERGYDGIVLEDVLDQAKQMEKEQIEIAFAKSYLIGCEEVSYNDANKASENYYNETYGGSE